MNAVLIFIYVGCTALMIFSAPDEIIPTILLGSENAVKFLPVLFGSYCLWIPIMKILEKCGIDRKLGKLINPISKKLFPKENAKVYEKLNLNISANLLGTGGAATPSGIETVGLMKSKKNKIMLVTVNALSIQLIPTTVISMRALKGAGVNILLPSLIATLVTTTIGVILVKLLVKE